MSKNKPTAPIIPESLNDRLVYLRKEWRSNNKRFEFYLTKNKNLKKLVYFLITVDKQSPSRVAELMDVKPPRITTIVNEMKKGGDTT